MKTATLIVRLVGLYLLVKCSIVLLQIQKVFPHDELRGQQAGIIGDIQFYAWIGLALGMAGTIFAGPLARLLTFDSEPKKRIDLSA